MTDPRSQAGRRPRLDPATARIRNAVREDLATVGEPSLFLVGISGGADSMALAAACAFLQGTDGHAFLGVTVDHGLQADSAEVAARTRDRVRALGLDHVVVRAEVTPGREGLEAAARTGRYTALARVAEDRGACAVLTGHTREDQAETVLLGLARGSGARALTGMSVSGTVHGVAVRRPLLDVSRADTRASCAARDIPVWEDPMNEDPRYARVRVRHTVLPVLEEELGPGIAEALARTASHLAADSAALEDLAAAAAGTLWGPAGDPAVVPAGASAMAEAVRTRVLRDWLRRCSGTSEEIGRHHVRAVDALLTGTARGAVSVPGAARVHRRTDGALEYRRVHGGPDGAGA